MIEIDGIEYHISARYLCLTPIFESAGKMPGTPSRPLFYQEFIRGFVAKNRFVIGGIRFFTALPKSRPWALCSRAAFANVALQKRLFCPIARRYLTSMSSYLLVPRPIFSACAMQVRQSVSGCVMQKGSLA